MKAIRRNPFQSDGGVFKAALEVNEHLIESVHELQFEGRATISYRDPNT